MRLIVAVLVLAAPLAAQCTFTVSPTSVTVPATASTGNIITVTAPGAPCDQRWIPSTQVSWLTVPATEQSTHTGSGTFTFSVDTNPAGVARSGDLTVNTALGPVLGPAPIHVTQTATVCKFGLNPSSQNVAVTGGPSSLTVTANCAWAASNNTSWINMPSAGGLTNGTIPFTVAANGCLNGRTGSISLVGSSLATPLVSNIIQDGSPSNFSLSASSAQADATAGDNRFNVNTGVGCGWSASSDVSWMTITSGATGSGNGAIAYHLLANTSATRTGNIHVTASPTTQFLFTVTQQAAGPPAPVIASVNNAANYATDAVSPGEIVTLFGQNLGPAPLVPLQVIGGSLTTTLGGTQVLFDGVAVPMIYSFQNQVSAIAPYGLAGKTSTQVQVRYNGVASAATTVPVQPTTPAIFTLDASGLGPGAILNQDNSTNGSALPAARGSVVAIYCTGGGTTNPATADGVVISGVPPVIALSVSVTIGGVGAKVSYAGAVPGSIAGLTQVNAEVPASVTPGSKVPVVVTINGVSSTSGVTIAVK